MNSLIKKLLIVSAIAAPVFLMSYTPEQPELARVGEDAPELAIAKGDTKISLKQMRGKQVVLHFWSKSDPESRIINYQNDRAYSDSTDVVYMAICTDGSDESLSKLIVAEDGNNSESQYYRSELMASSNLDAYTHAGGGTWIISPEGIIVSHPVGV